MCGSLAYDEVRYIYLSVVRLNLTTLTTFFILSESSVEIRIPIKVGSAEKFKLTQFIL